VKSHLAQAIATQLALPVIDLDDIFCRIVGDANPSALTFRTWIDD